MVAALSSLLETISSSGDTDCSQAFMGSFWPDYLEEFTGIYNNTIVYTIITISVLQKTYPKHNTHGGKTTRYIHQNELPPIPKQ
jgi:hypothetical protein